MDAAGNLKHGLKAGTAPLRWERKNTAYAGGDNAEKNNTAAHAKYGLYTICNRAGQSFLTVGFDPILYDDSNRQAQNAAKHAPIQ